MFKAKYDLCIGFKTKFNKVLLKIFRITVLFSLIIPIGLGYKMCRVCVSKTLGFNVIFRQVKAYIRVFLCRT